MEEEQLCLFEDTIIDNLNRVGLKKATFYNLLTEYRKSEK